MEDDIERCPHCGEPCEDDEDIMHRGCRLKAAFPGTYTSDGGLLKFDVGKIKAALEAK